MSDLAKLRIWDDPAILGALSWYLDVAENRRPAKFRIAATVAVGLDPALSSEDELWRELDRLTPLFLTRWHEVRAGAPRVLRTKADRFFWFDEVPDDALFDGKFNAPMLWNSNFFMTLESMKILRILTDVWLPDFKFGPGRCAMTLAKTPWYWETVTRNIALIEEWGQDFSIRHLVMPNHVECCTYPVLEWIAERVPAAPVNVMAQFHPDNFCDSASAKYRDKYVEIARRPSRGELNNSWRRARELGLKFETTTFERSNTLGL